MVRTFNKLIQPYARRIRLTVSRGIVRLVNDALKLQEVQIALLADETSDQVERFQNYGITSVPLSGAEGVFLSVGGSRDHGVIIAIDDRRYRLKGLQPGEVALYDDQGQVIKLKRGKAIEITGCDTLTATCAVSVTLDTPLLTCTGNLQVDGNITVTGNATAIGNMQAANVAAIAAITGATVAATTGISGASVTATGEVIGASVTASGEISDATGSMADMRLIYDTHVHPENGAGGGITGPTPQVM